MKMKKILFYVIPILLGGCIPIMSLDPFFTEKDVVFEEKILDTWVDDINDPETIWKFSIYEELPFKAYKLDYIDQEDRKGSFIAVLMKLDNTLFFNVFPDKKPWGTEDPNNIAFFYNTLFFVPANTILRVDAIEPYLLIRLTQASDFTELIQDHPGEIELKQSENTIVLTSSTKELQEFIMKYSDDKRMFPGEIKLIRKKE